MRVKNLNGSALKFPALLLPLGIGLTMPAMTAYATITSPDEVIVTARRMKEEAQTVPISMAVFNQEMLSERNVTNGADLATFTPSLSVNTRFGSDQTTFAIRGFTQELRTTASVAVYFADVVAPRGGGSVTSGDGAGPGAFFDLQNVQVLKGPQGTLFGRNTTGGAIQLVPQEPTTKFEGYLELSDGNYDMHRYQGVVNVPITDDIRARFGFDRQTRDGYINNISGIGPDNLSNIDYTAGRASVMWHITDTLRNYTIYNYTYSRNNGSIEGIFQCNTVGGVGGVLCDSSYNAWQNGGGDFYDVVMDTPDSTSMLRQWQLINSTTWDASDDLTVKNILSFAHLTQTTRSSVFGTNISIDGKHYWFFPAGSWHGIPTNSQETFVEELQFQGKGFDDKLTWQAGLYYEKSKPDGISGSLSPALAACTIPSNDVQTWNCSDVLPSGGVVSNLGTIEYTNMAAYTQSTYEISDEFRITLGLRYTVDESDGESKQQSFTFAPKVGDPVSPADVYFVPDPSQLAPGQVSGFSCAAAGGDRTDYCAYKMNQRSEAPTWLIGLDYLPSTDVMIYAKYARGYRQGSVSIFAPDGLQEFDPEEVDAYEIGAKTSFHGAVSGTFNIAVFYNELKNQQLQANYVPCGLTAPCPPGTAAGGRSPTTAILNAGQSTIQGVELETTLKLLPTLIFTTSYTYLETHLDSLEDYPNSTGYVGSANSTVGKHLSFSPRHSVTAGLSYGLPVPADLGEISFGGSYSFVSEQESCSTRVSPYCTLSSRRLVSFNANWKAIMSGPFDASLFVNNAFDEEVTTYVPGLYEQVGADYRTVGEPRMYGVKVKYSF